MKKTLLMLLAAAFAAFSVSAAETKASAEKNAAEKAAKPAAEKAVKKAAKPRKKYVMPADGGLQIATTPKARNNPNAKRKSGWHKRYDAKLKQIADYKNDVDMVWIGDSITHFWEKDCNGNNNKYKIGGLNTYKKYFSNYKVINLGYSGDRTENTLWVVNESGYLKNLKAKMAVVMIGTNNIGHKRSTSAAAAAGVTKIVEGIRTQLPDAKIVLFGVFPRGANAKHIFRKQVAEINKVICKLGDDKNVFYCDITDKFVDKKGNLPRTLMPDVLHPNDAGYEIWAQAMMPYVEKFVGKK